MRCTNVSTTLGEYTREKSSAGSVCTMAGTLSRSKPRPVTGVVATTWNAGIWDAGVGADAGEGAGAPTRAGRAARAGLAAGAARRTGAGRVAATVTSRSVAAACPQAEFAPVKPPDDASAPSAAARNTPRFAAASRDASRPYPPAPRMAPTGKFSQILEHPPAPGLMTFCQFASGTFGNVAAGTQGLRAPLPPDVKPPTEEITGGAVSKRKNTPGALASELARASRLWGEYYVISVES